MFRARHRPEKNARASAQRGSVGSARVWDETTRALRVAAPAQERTQAPLGGPPDELAALIQGIVSVTLDTRLTELERPRRAALASELERRLLEVFRPSTPAPAAGGPPAAAPELPPGLAAPDARESAPGREELAPARGPAGPAPALRALTLVLEQRLARLGAPLMARPELCARLAELLTAFRTDDRTPAEAGDGLLRDLDVLARRASKLERALHDTRAALAYVSGLEHVDTGLASIYRQVQGLAHDDPRRAHKSEALARIFQANLELRRARNA